MSSYDNWKTTNPDDERLGRANGNPIAYGCLQCPWRGKGMSAAVAHYWASHSEHTVVPMTDPRMREQPRKATA